MPNWVIAVFLKSPSTKMGFLIHTLEKPMTIRPVLAVNDMFVRIDGELKTRPIAHWDETSQRLEPELEDGEEALWFIGSKVPTIIKTGK